MSSKTANWKAPTWYCVPHPVFCRLRHMSCTKATAPFTGRTPPNLRAAGRGRKSLGPCPRPGLCRKQAKRRRRFLCREAWNSPLRRPRPGSTNQITSFGPLTSGRDVHRRELRRLWSYVASYCTKTDRHPLVLLMSSGNRRRNQDLGKRLLTPELFQAAVSFR